MTDAAAANPDLALRLEGITKGFAGGIANDGISLNLRRGEILGLLGENGAGKTTLMNILFGYHVADAGKIEVDGKPLPPGSPAAALAAGIGMIHRDSTLADNLTVLENITLGTENLFRLKANTKKARQRLADLIKQYGLDINIDAKVGTLPAGEKQRVEILKALYRNVRILILDEPTAVLTPQESLALLRKLMGFAKQGLSVILLSHKLGEVLAGCHRIIVLRSGKVAGERFPKTTTRLELSELMVGKAITPPKLEDMPRGAPLLIFKNLSARCDGQKLEDVSVEIHKHEILGLAGVSGNGQSLLADIISGTFTPSSGTVTVQGSEIETFTPTDMIVKGLARLPQDRVGEGLFGDMSITENLLSESYLAKANSRRGWINWREARTTAEKRVAEYDIKCKSPNVSARRLSDTDKQRLILSRTLSSNPKIILANQPTRGLNVAAASFVHDQLLAARRRGAGILLISEDLDEILSLSDRVCVMFQGKLTAPIWRSEVKFADLGLMMSGQKPEAKAEPHAA